MVEKAKVLMMVGAGDALKYKRENPNADSQEILRHIMSNFRAKSEFKVFAIAAASKALEYKEKNRNATEKEIMQKVMDESNEILKSSLESSTPDRE